MPSPVHTYFADEPELVHLREGSFYIGERADGAEPGALDAELFDRGYGTLWRPTNVVQQMLAGAMARLPLGTYERPMGVFE